MYASRHGVVKKDGDYSREHDSELEAHEMDELVNDNIFHANQSLRTIALCYKDMEVWPPRGCAVSAEDEVCYCLTYALDVKLN